MDRSRSSSAPVPHRTAPLPALTPAQFGELVGAKLDEVRASLAAWALPVVVTGLLGEFPPVRFGTIYRLPLTDPDVPATAAYMNVRETTLERAGVRPGDLVRVTGAVAAELFRGDVSIRLQVFAVEHEVPEEAPRQRVEKIALETIRRLALNKRPFPVIVQPTLALIHSAASEARVADDFLGALGSAVPPENIRRIPTSMRDPAALVKALRDARSDVVALVRGGGEALDFQVFERPEVLEALGACIGYRVLGLGHTADRTLAELVADHAASTPAAAGEHVRRQIADRKKRSRTDDTVAELREALERERELRKADADAALLAFEPEEPKFPVEAFHRKSMSARVTPLFWAAVLGAAAAWAVLRWM